MSATDMAYRDRYALEALRPVQLTRRGKAVQLVGIVAGASLAFTGGLMLPRVSSAELHKDTYSCPAGSSLTSFEDGSGACYAPGSNKPALRDGRPVVWPVDTFGWDCATMGNRLCGPK